MKKQPSILDDIYSVLAKETKNCPSPDHKILAIRVGTDCFRQMCKEDASIYDTHEFCGIPVWQSQIEITKVIFGPVDVKKP